MTKFPLTGKVTAIPDMRLPLIELPFCQEDNRQFTFHAKRLKWPPEAN